MSKRTQTTRLAMVVSLDDVEFRVSRFGDFEAWFADHLLACVDQETAGRETAVKLLDQAAAAFIATPSGFVQVALLNPTVNMLSVGASPVAAVFAATRNLGSGEMVEVGEDGCWCGGELVAERARDEDILRALLAQVA